MSVRASAARPAACSGAMYSGGPIAMPGLVSRRSRAAPAPVALPDFGGAALAGVEGLGHVALAHAALADQLDDAVAAFDVGADVELGRHLLLEEGGRGCAALVRGARRRRPRARCCGEQAPVFRL